ncbi:hypothetical protein Pst134EA_032684 [Puccinia striiformis f. sp. tritici]|uniref:uncharacterized protein n=1 Tax=Puccinia striiformis f. sp. tritici TaxID=168172 RepID=UPI002008D318|nr:uncharacterized protein Pst134EA_032684 [Puccinia striiformis f. sp. tritici]KAH9441674.1 hypothetical protein Pst134EA_032684 [Puccinia striiformis f. sp. tritici]
MPRHALAPTPYDDLRTDTSSSPNGENSPGSQPVDGVLLTRFQTVGAFSVLDARIQRDERLRAIETLMSFQHPQGGFGGGPGQLAHLASTYASISALAILLDGVDQSILEETCAPIDRKKMYEWMLSLKMPDGSFRMHRGGEIDVR